MSADDQGGAGRREVAYRLFAAEFEDADLSYSESDEERAPNYVVTPTGARVNRLFLVGVLTEVEAAGEDILRARVVDPTGAFVVYAGQYQPEAQAFFDRAEPPMFVAVTGKARTFQPEDSDVTYTSVRPENVNEVSAETRDRWSVGTARQTLSRVATMARALDREERGDDLRRLLEEQGVDVGLAAGIPLAIDHYGTSGVYLEALRDLSVQVAEVVANERDEVDPFSTSPEASGQADLAALATLDVAGSAGGDGTVVADAVAASGTTDSSGSSTVGGSDSTATASSSDSTATASSSDSSAATSGESTSSSSTADTGSADTASTTASSESSDESASTATGETTSAPTGEPTSASTAGDDSGVGEPTESAEPAETTASTGTDETAESTDPAETTETATGATAGSTGEPEGGAGAGEDIGDFEPGEFDLDEEEREAIEEEYGTSFQSGTEVDDPGEADIDTPEPNTDEAPVGADSTTDEESTTEAVSASTDEADDESTEDAAETDDESTEDAAETDDESTEDAADVDIDEAVMDAMRDNDGGEGASEDAIVDAVADRLGVSADEVREALEEALMGGQCYEPEDGVYKPI